VFFVFILPENSYRWRGDNLLRFADRFRDNLFERFTLYA
jgi:hypothetical protein